MRTPWNSLWKNSHGFTLIEVLMVASIIVLVTSFLISNFSETRLNLDQTMNLIVADIRDVQNKALTSSTYSGALRCGYGISYLTLRSFQMYTSPIASSVCSGYNRNYEAGVDLTVRTITIGDQEVEFFGRFPDVFFEPPNPTTFIDNVSTLDAPPSSIIISKAGTNCYTDRGNCRIICVYPSGRIDTSTGSTCP